ncbi:hypothetical protein LZ32DRAFT_405983 [Colletotrichum eremochloae]|nr:hypothetical protein LZ32DRAFT_405983 [Colletotrichum eremochloae]
MAATCVFLSHTSEAMFTFVFSRLHRGHTQREHGISSFSGGNVMSPVKTDAASPEHPPWNASKTFHLVVCRQTASHTSTSSRHPDAGQHVVLNSICAGDKECRVRAWGAAGNVCLCRPWLHEMLLATGSSATLDHLPKKHPGSNPAAGIFCRSALAKRAGGLL